MGRRSSKASRPAGARIVVYKNRAIGIRWHLGEKEGEVSSGTLDRDEAIGERAIILRDLREGIFPTREADGPSIIWKDFRQRYQNEHLVSLSEGSNAAWATAANHLQRLAKPKKLIDVTKAMLSRFRGDLLAEGKSPNSVATYLRTIRAALGWAYELDLIRDLPKIKARKGIKKSNSMRSRPITGEEFDRIISLVPKKRPKDADQITDFINGLWHSLLRIDELRRLSWDECESLRIDESGKYPMIFMRADGHKGRRDCYQPITPEFWKLISKPGRIRSGYVLPLPGRGGRQMARKSIIRIVNAIGKASMVVTDTTTGKYATSHDIGRRAGLTRLSRKLKLSQVQQLARHTDPQTTSQFYIRDDAEELAEATGWESRCNGVAEGQK
jgi:integrase